MRVHKLLIAIFFCVTSPLALSDAQEGFYLGLAGRYIDSGVLSDKGGTVGFSGAEVSFGYKDSDWLGLEVRAGKSTRDEVSFESDFRIPFYYSAYYRAELASKVAKAFVLVGYTDLEVEAQSLLTGITSTSADSGFSWGAGLGFAIKPNVNMNFEYLKLLTNDDNDFDIGGMSLDFRF